MPVPQAATTRAGVAERGGPGREARQGPFSAGGFLIMLLAMGVEAVVLYILLKPSPIAGVAGGRPGEVVPAHSAAELMAPTVTIPEVIVSIPVRDVGTELRTAVLSVTLRLGKAEGRADEELDLKYLEKVYVPKVKALIPELRHEIIMQAQASTFSDLRRREAKILEALKAKMNELLKSYGVEPRVQEIFWSTFHFD